MLRRQVRLWLVPALAGLALGSAVAALGSERGASIRLLVTHRVDQDPTAAMATDASLAESRTVAQRVVDRLRLDETATELLSRYTATPLTDRVLEVTVVAPTGASAVRIAAAVGEEFLRVRADQARARLEPLRAGINESRSHVGWLRENTVPGITPVGVEESSPRERLAQAKDRVAELKAALREEEAAVAAMSQSRTLDPAAPDPSPGLFPLARDAVAGLLAGLVLGIGFVLGRGVFTDRPWQPAAIADLLGTPLAVGVGRVGPDRWWHRLWPLVPRPRAGSVDATVRWLRTELDGALDGAAAGASKPALTVVSADCAPAAALVMASVAHAYAAEGRHVLVADLTGEAVLAKRLGVSTRGTSQLPGLETGSMTIHLPRRAAPIGLLRHRGADEPSWNEEDRCEPGLVVAWCFAEVVLTLTEFCPDRDSANLDTWSTRAVALVAAGGPTSAGIDEIGYRIRVAGLELGSAVVLGADREALAARDPLPELRWGTAR